MNYKLLFFIYNSINILPILFYSITLNSFSDIEKTKHAYTLFLVTFILTIVKIGITVTSFLLKLKIKKQYYTNIVYTILIIIYSINIINSILIFGNYNNSLYKEIMSEFDVIIYVICNCLTISIDIILTKLYFQYKKEEEQFIQMV